jgi:hypothetical protein
VLFGVYILFAPASNLSPFIHGNNNALFHVMCNSMIKFDFVMLPAKTIAHVMVRWLLV